MSNVNGDSLSVQEKLAFFGMITAGVSHDINNVNAIIRELAGLMEDLFYGAEQTGQLNTDKLKEIVQKIGDQTKRGEKNIKRLNRFSHSVDYPSQNFSLNGLIMDITDLSQRFARLKRITLSLDLPEVDTEIESSPFLLQYLIFSCIELLLETSTEYEKINVSFAEQNGSVSIDITGKISEKGNRFDDRMNMIRKLTNDLSCEFNMKQTEDNRDVLALIISNTKS